MDAPTTTLSQDRGAIYEQHSIARTLVLHLLPGVLMLAFFIAGAPLVVGGLEFPPLMAVYLAILFVLIPFELGYLLYQARKRGVPLGDIVLYRQPVPRGQFLALVLALFVWGIIIYPLSPWWTFPSRRACSPGCPGGSTFSMASPRAPPATQERPCSSRWPSGL